MLRGSAWAARRDRALASIEESQQRLVDWEEKRARRRAEFSARIPVMAAEVAAEMKAAVTAAVTAEVTAAVTSALDAAFERRPEAIGEALANALARPRASSAMTPASSPSDLHAPLQDASVTSERTMNIRTAAPADSISTAVGAASICNNFKFALAAPITCSTQCPGGNVTVPVFLAPAATSALFKATIRVVPEHSYVDPEPAAADSTATLTSPIAASILTVCVVRGGDLDLAAPTTCSTTYLGGDPSALVASMMTSMVLGEAGVTTACMSRGSCADPVAHPVAMPTTVHVAAADCALTRTVSNDVVTLGSRVLSPATTKPASSVALESDLMMAPPMAISAQLTCSSVERPVAFIAARNVADDHIINNKQEVAQQLRLLELPPFETNEQNVVPLLPQVTRAMASCAKSMNQREAKVIGMCSSLGYPTSNCISICLFQWDPGEHTSTSRNLVVSRDIDLNACAKELTKDSSDRSDHYKKPGENATSKCFLKGICVELLPCQFNYVGSSCQQSMEDHVACAPAYSSHCVDHVTFEDFLLGSYCATQSSFHLLYPEASVSFAASSAPYGSISRPWKIVGSCLFDIWRAIQNTVKPWPSWEKALLVPTVLQAIIKNCHSIVVPLKMMGEGTIILPYLGNLCEKQYSRFKVLQFGHAKECFIWKIAWFLVESGHTISKHKLLGHWEKLIFVPLIQSPYCCTALQSNRDSTLKFPSVGNIFHGLQAAKPPNSNSTCDIILDQRSSLGLLLLGVLELWTHLTLVKITQWHHRGINYWKYPRPSVHHIMLKRNNSFSSSPHIGLGLLHYKLLQKWLHFCLMRHYIQCPLELLQRKIAWLINWERNEDSGTNFKEFVPSIVCEETLQGNFVIVCHWVASVTAVYMFCAKFRESCSLLTDMKHNNLLLHDQKAQLPWDPGGIWEILGFSERDCKQVETGGMHVNLTFFVSCGCCYHTIFYLFQVLVDSGYYRNYNSQERQVQWDPGGCARRRLEVKPKIKEGGMLAACLTGRWTTTIGPGPARKPVKEGGNIYQHINDRKIWLGTGRLRPPLASVSFFLPGSQPLQYSMDELPISQ